MKVSIVAEDNYVFSKKIKTVDDRTKFDLEKINQIYAKASLGLTPYFNLYGKLGAGDGGKIDTLNRDNLRSVKVETDYGLLWAVGASGAKEISDGWKLGLDAQFGGNKMDVKKVTFGGGATSGVGGAIENYELQITPFITKKFSFDQWGIDPYLGCVVNYLWTETKSNLKYTQGGTEYTEGWTLSNKHKVGIAVGSDIEFAERWAAQLEGRFIEETAISVGVAYRF
jgi:hypothetical protein